MSGARRCSLPDHEVFTNSHTLLGQGSRSGWLLTLRCRPVRSAAGCRQGGCPSLKVFRRMRGSPYVNGQLASLRFFAGAPLLSSEGQLLGTL